MDRAAGAMTIALAISLLVACGGGGGSGGVPAPAASASLSTVTTDISGPVKADGLQTVQVTVGILNRNGQPIPGETVTVSVSGTGNVLVQPPATDTQGLTTTTLAATEEGARTLTVTAGTGNGAVTLEDEVTLDFVFGPRLTGPARYQDVNSNAVADAGDTVVLRVDQPFTLGAAIPGHLALPVSGDSFGAGATLATGPGTDELTVTLGNGATLRTRQDFAATRTVVGSATGLDFAAGLADDVLVGTTSGMSAQPDQPVDLVPVYQFGTALPVQALDVVLADLDHDGDLDAAFVIDDGLSVRVFVNDGDGNLTDSGQSLAMSAASELAVGDVDHDSHPDLVVGDRTAGTRVFLNNGAGTFIDSGQALAAGLDIRDVALGNVDGDGDPDLVLGVFNGNDRVFLNDGSGVFTDSLQSLGGGSTTAVALADLDRDGDPDCVCGISGAPSRVYWNDGAGTFTDSGQTLGNGATTDVALGDLDGDGDTDLVEAVQGAADRVYRNDGTGTFRDSGQALVATSLTRTVALADHDQDGDLDLVQATDTTNEQFLNDGSGVFTRLPDPLEQAMLPGVTEGLAVGDVDRDGDLDLITANRSGADTRLWHGSLAGTYGDLEFAAVEAMSQSLVVSGQAADVDGDGDLDLVAVELNFVFGAARVLFNNGDGTFTEGAQSFGTFLNEVQVGDLDGDGDPDLVATDKGMVVYRNDGTGQFTDTGQQFNGATQSLALGDLDGDGDLDVAVARGEITARPNDVLFNDGTGLFTDSLQSLGSSITASLVAGDLDHDGDLDLVAGNGLLFDQPNVVYFNDGSGTFTADPTTLGNDGTDEVALVDVDRDGDLDLWVSNLSITNALWWNDGAGQFTDSGQLLGGTGTAAGSVFGDLDGDGDHDLVLTLVAPSPQVLLNDGAGVLTDSGLTLGLQMIGALHVDLDGDGDGDLISFGPGNFGWLARH